MLRLETVSGKSALNAASAPVPQPGRGEILIEVHAAGVTPSELQWYPTTHTRAGAARAAAIPGHEFSGVLAAVGPDVDAGQIGAAVFGMNDWFADGAAAEYCIAQPASVAPESARLSHAEAATVPIGALTAWQGLFKLREREARKTCESLRPVVTLNSEPT